MRFPSPLPCQTPQPSLLASLGNHLRSLWAVAPVVHVDTMSALTPMPPSLLRKSWKVASPLLPASTAKNLKNLLASESPDTPPLIIPQLFATSLPSYPKSPHSPGKLYSRKPPTRAHASQASQLCIYARPATPKTVKTGAGPCRRSVGVNRQMPTCQGRAQDRREHHGAQRQRLRPHHFSPEFQSLLS